MWIRKPARYTVSGINRVSQVAGILGIVFLIAMMLLTVSDVCLRYVFNAPISGSLELTEYFMVCAGFLCVAWCAVKRGHVKVDLILEHVPPRVQAIVDSISIILALTVVPLVAWQGFVQARYVQMSKLTSDVLEIPHYPFYWVVGIGYGLLFLVLVTVLVEFIGKALKR